MGRGEIDAIVFPGVDLSIPPLAVRLILDHLEKENPDEVHAVDPSGLHTDAAVGRMERLSEDEKGAVYAAYQGINETAGVTPGLQMQGPETATTVRVQDGKTLTTDGPFLEIKESIGGYLFFEADDLAIARSAGRATGLPTTPASGW